MALVIIGFFTTLVLASADTTFAGEITVGSLNIEWFGDAIKPRSDEQIQRLAGYIRSLEVDILVCQEINPNGDQSENAVADWIDLQQALGPGYAGCYGKTGKRQRLAFIWRTDRVEVSDLGELRVIERGLTTGTQHKTFPRIPLTAYVKSLNGGLDFRVVNVHLYATDENARHAEASRLAAWVSEYLGGACDKDIVLIGDFNAECKGTGVCHYSTTINSLEADGTLRCISKDHEESTTAISGLKPDQAFLSNDFLDQYVQGSWDVRRERAEDAPNAYKHDIGNHCPVTFRILDKDMDCLPAGDWSASLDSCKTINESASGKFEGHL